DGYYRGGDVFATSGSNYFGPQPVAMDRSAMLAGSAATFVTTAGPLSTALGFMLPGDLDGSNLPPAGAPDPYISAAGSTWSIYRFHVHFVTPSNSTVTDGGDLAPAGFTNQCPTAANCVPPL